MSACASIPSLGATAPRRVKRHRSLKGSEKFGFGFLLLFLGVSILTRGAVGAEPLVAAIVCGFFLLPLEHVAVSVALAPLLPTVLDSLPHWYVDQGRWFLIFVGTAVIWFRGQRSSRQLRSPSVSLFRALFLLFTVVAGITVFSSTSPSLSGAKWLLLVAALISFWSASQWLVRAKGGAAAAAWVRAWLFVLVPILLGNVAARFWSSQSTIAGSGFRGLAGNPNSLGVVLALALPLLICQFLYRRRRPTGLLVQGYGILIVASLFMLYTSWSRASMAAFLVGLAVLFWIHPINRLNRFAVLGALLLLAVFVSGPQRSLQAVESWLYKGRADESLLAARSEQWQLGYETFRERPLLGSGFGVTSASEDLWEIDTFRYLKVEQGSSLSALLAQVGLLGSAPIYMALIWVLTQSVIYARRVRDPWLSGIVASAFVGFFNSFFEGWMASPGSGLFWFVVPQFFFLDAVMSHLRPPRPLPFPRVPYATTAPRHPATTPALRPAGVTGRVGHH